MVKDSITVVSSVPDPVDPQLIGLLNPDPELRITDPRIQIHKNKSRSISSQIQRNFRGNKLMFTNFNDLLPYRTYLTTYLFQWSQKRPDWIRIRY